MLLTSLLHLALLFLNQNCMFFCSSFGNFFLKYWHKRLKVGTKFMNVFTCKDICWVSRCMLQLLSVKDDYSFGTTPPIWEPAFTVWEYFQYFISISVSLRINLSSPPPPPRPGPPHPNFAMCKFWAKYPLICLKFWNLSSGKFCEAHVKIKYRQHEKVYRSSDDIL